MWTALGKVILGGLVEIGHGLGLILAEGVESERQVEVLRQLHCDVFQGFRFSVPVPETKARRRILEGARCLKDRGSEELGHGVG